MVHARPLDATSGPGRRHDLHADDSARQTTMDDRRTTRVRALRGATTLDVDDRDHLLARTGELIDELFARNDLAEDDLVSLVFTATDDISSAFPAEAARHGGITHVPLLCARELDIDGGIPRCIRILAHVYTDRTPTELRHPYLHDARQLRTDLPE